MTKMVRGCYKTIIQLKKQHSFLIILSLFGAVIDVLKPVELDDNGNPKVDLKTMQTNDPDVFCGGDFAGVANTTVDSVNDGKTAAWFMHRRIQVPQIN